jgi:hypothetical protein
MQTKNCFALTDREMRLVRHALEDIFLHQLHQEQKTGVPYPDLNDYADLIDAMGGDSLALRQY